MASSSSSDHNFVTLVCYDPIEDHHSIPDDEILISTAYISNWDTSFILHHRTLKIKADRTRLVEESWFFECLFTGHFSDSDLEFISIQWDRESFVSVMKCVHHLPLDISHGNLLALVEAALYFGVKRLLLECHVWLLEFSSSKESSQHMVLDDFIDFWNFGTEHAIQFLSELSVRYLAGEFRHALSSKCLKNFPYDLLISCLKHPCLLIDSEMQLAEAILVWIDTKSKEMVSSEGAHDHYADVLKQIRVRLLPFWYIAGKTCSFFKCVKQSVQSICYSNQQMDFVNLFETAELHHLRVRLTDRTEIMNLSGSPLITTTVLLLSLVPSSYYLDCSMRENVKKLMLYLEDVVKDHEMSMAIRLPLLLYKPVQEVDISKCHKLYIRGAIKCFSSSFHQLRTLKAAHLLNFKTAMMYEVMKKCPNLSELDLTLDVFPIAQFSVEAFTPNHKCTDPVTLKDHYAAIDSFLKGGPSYHSGVWLSNIRRLSLEGRVDVYDSDLEWISASCIYLQHLNLKGCFSITDKGMSSVMHKCLNLNSIVVCNTSFGNDSVRALLHGVPNLDGNTPTSSRTDNFESLTPKLQMLHMGGCKGVDKMLLLHLMSHTPYLKSLCLRNTNLDDIVLSSLSSSSLEMLDVTDNVISSACLAHVILKNPGLKILKARGCRNMLQPEGNSEKRKASSLYSWGELYLFLRSNCTLKEISLGWGFSDINFEALKPAITCLKSLTVGLGGSIGKNSLCLLPSTCPMLESLILYFQVISDEIVLELMASLKHLQELSLCYCYGELSMESFKPTMSCLRKLMLQRVTPWLTNPNLCVLTENCPHLVELCLLGCMFLNSDTQEIISHGWPGLVTLHLEECGHVTAQGISHLFECIALEVLFLRHNGRGIQRSFILDACAKLPMLRQISLDLCDARECGYAIPDNDGRYPLNAIKVSRCQPQRSLDLQIMAGKQRLVHKDTLVAAWDGHNLKETLVKERI